MRVSTIQVGDKSVILVDCSNMTTAQADEIKLTLNEAKERVASNPEKSVYIITVLTNLKFNTDITNEFKEYATANTKYVKESVLVGLSGLQSIILSAVKKLTKREFYLSNSLSDAKEYLTTCN